MFTRFAKWQRAIFLGGLIFALVVLIPGYSSAQHAQPYSSTCNNQIWQTRPIPLGVSGGNINDSSTAYCCGGTLGCLVQDASLNQYILSCNHVLARTNKGLAGEGIIQPGLVDSLCRPSVANEVATLNTPYPLINFKKNSVNYVDAAVAEVVPGDVVTNGTINCIGGINGTPVSPALNLAVQKSGRTTGVTSGAISATNVTIKVAYNITCGIGSQTAVFKNQIGISGSGFSQGGDSGSLILTNPASGCPQPVGLLFAGSNTQTFANPIQAVLQAFSGLGYNLTIVGACTGTAALSATQEVAPSTEVAAIKAIKERHEDAIMEIEGVVGMGIGQSADGTHHLEIYVKKLTPGLEKQLPKSLEGVKVIIIETGEVRAF